MSIHKTVLLEEAVKGLNLKKGLVVVDATLGGGGHSLRILEKILPGGKLISIDRDENAIKGFRNKIDELNLKIEPQELILINDNFSNIGEALDELGIEKVDAILADFGLSSDQLDSNERGFSFQSDSKLDMRMDQKQALDAYQVINEYSFEELERIIRIFGDEKFSKKIAREIESRREKAPIETTKELVEIVEKAIPNSQKKRGINPATKTFQAIRMEVNQEIESIEKFLQESINRLNSEGRLSVISFHSGEDRVVKNIFKESANDCICPKEFPVCVCDKKAEIEIITKKPIVPSDVEIEENPRSRSAKLRIVQKK
ncbi:MAG: 16S rRNA (cytosine(1402)-N(4))-methyltransferase RsmH [Candidatus Moranbacteria bacterium]|nr:16S rRNA (cytosine(1402)-N(4))-methyltransferase RsmH [Candidatus Moranbacteria bacterium]